MKDQDVKEIFDRLEDELSRKTFQARLQLSQDDDKVAFAKQMLKLYPNMKFQEIDQFQEASQKEKLVIYGESERAMYMYEVLDSAGYDVQIYKCIEELVLSDLYGYIVFESEHVTQLLQNKICESAILYGKRLFTGRVGWQYFDVFSPKEDECFVDIGGFSGETSADFIKWCKGKYENIYLFEPNPYMMTKCKERIEKEQISNITTYQIAVSDSTKKGMFWINESFMYTAKIADEGKVPVDIDRLDNVLKNKRVTFTKLDVEGEELHV